jgi:hypothetical protein
MSRAVVEMLLPGVEMSEMSIPGVGVEMSMLSVEMLMPRVEMLMPGVEMSMLALAT